MFRALLIASIIVTGSPVFAAQGKGAQIRLGGDDAVFRVDPGKTLKLIKRIKDAGGNHVAS